MDWSALTVLIAIVSSLLLVAGMIRPIWVLWWRPSQTRYLVLRTYGLMAIVTWAIYLVQRSIF